MAKTDLTLENGGFTVISGNPGESRAKITLDSRKLGQQNVGTRRIYRIFPVFPQNWLTCSDFALLLGRSSLFRIKLNTIHSYSS
ncbi:hypothetical protein D3C76_1239920 [compost metagenome]